MSGFDIAVLLVVGSGAIFGFARGFVHEVLSLSAWALAVVCIRLFHTDLTDGLSGWMGQGTGGAVLAFVLLAVVPYAAVRLLAAWLGSRSRNSALGPVDRVLGFGFGAVKATIIVVMVFSVVALAYDTVWGPAGRPDWMTTGRTYPFVNASSNEMVHLIAERRRQALEADADTDGQTGSEAAAGVE